MAHSKATFRLNSWVNRVWIDMMITSFLVYIKTIEYETRFTARTIFEQWIIAKIQQELTS